ncbi:MAG: phytanoyl-CoA dioxygenase family protein [Acidobacteriota bacterium]|nr:phytanoyl-CoA dioxygenase family protein [Acidobacteriota bacterium]
MDTTPIQRLPTEEDVFDLQTGSTRQLLSLDEQHFFDIAGYALLPEVLNPGHIEESRQRLESLAEAPSAGVSLRRENGSEVELLNIIEAGGVLEDAMALQPVLRHLQALIWGRQFRLIASRARIRGVGSRGRLTQGGKADPRRYASYRCGPEGEFRCLLVTCLIALDDTNAEDGAFCLIPGSHKCRLPHPYADRELDQVPPLQDLPLTAGSAVVFTENVSHALRTPRLERQSWLEFQYGPSYMENWPGCEPSADLLRRTQADPVKSHLLLAPYYHPAGSQKKMD